MSNQKFYSLADCDDEIALSLEKYEISLKTMTKEGLIDRAVIEYAANLKKLKQENYLSDYEQRIEEFVENSFQNWEVNHTDEDEIRDSICEEAQQCVPIYNWNLLNLAQNEMWLATEDEHGVDANNALDFIRYNLQTHLEHVGLDKYETLKLENS